jgi:hypothetical protein
MGGCSITSYDVYKDDGNNGAFDVAPLDAATSNLPYLFEYTFTIPNPLIGKTIRYKL